jgi:predicted AAA+ superfamily ATPase
MGLKFEKSVSLYEDLGKVYCYWQYKFNLKAFLCKIQYFYIVDSNMTHTVMHNVGSIIPNLQAHTTRPTYWSQGGLECPFLLQFSVMKIKLQLK